MAKLRAFDIQSPVLAARLRDYPHTVASSAFQDVRHIYVIGYDHDAVDLVRVRKRENTGYDIVTVPVSITIGMPLEQLILEAVADGAWDR